MLITPWGSLQFPGPSGERCLSNVPMHLIRDPGHLCVSGGLSPDGTVLLPLLLWSCCTVNECSFISNDSDRGVSHCCSSCIPLADLWALILFPCSNDTLIRYLRHTRFVDVSLCVACCLAHYPAIFPLAFSHEPSLFRVIKVRYNGERSGLMHVRHRTQSITDKTSAAVRSSVPRAPTQGAKPKTSRNGDTLLRTAALGAAQGVPICGGLGLVLQAWGLGPRVGPRVGHWSSPVLKSCH